MGWYEVLDENNNIVKLIYITNLEDLANNVPEGCTIRPHEPEQITL